MILQTFPTLHLDIDCSNQSRSNENIQAAAKNGNVTAVAILLDCNGTNVNAVGKDGKGLLHLASENGRCKMLSLLLGQPLVDVNKGDNDGQTPLYMASQMGHDHVVKIFLNQTKLNVNKERSTDGRTPLIVAAEFGHSGVVRLLMKHPNLDVNKRKNTTGSTALGMAATKGHLEVVKLLVDHPCTEINMGNDLGESALILASRFGHERVSQILMDNSKIDINHATRNRKTALMVAAYYGKTKIVNLLLTHPDIAVNLATFEGKTALLYAVLQQEAEIVTLLLRCPRTDTEMMDEGYKTALQYASDMGFTYVVEAFESRGYLIMQNGHTCCSDKIDRGLITAVELDDSDWVKTIMKCPQLDINTANEDGYTPMFLAATSNQKEMVRVLSSSSKIDINKHVTDNNETPLMVCAEKGNPAIVRLLLAHVQINTNKVDSHGISALDKATYGGELRHLRAVKLLLRCPMTLVPKQYDINIQKDIAEALNMRSIFLQMIATCCLNVKNDLLAAAWIGDVRGIGGILRCPKSNVNTVDYRGRTPLFLASMQGHNQAVGALLTHGDIDLNIGTNTGATAFSIASEKSHFQVMEQIIKKVSNAGTMRDGWCLDNWTPVLILCKWTTGKETTLTATSPVTGRTFRSTFKTHI